MTRCVNSLFLGTQKFVAENIANISLKSIVVLKGFTYLCCLGGVVL